jgi:hypothetical protein
MLLWIRLPADLTDTRRPFSAAQRQNERFLRREIIRTDRTCPGIPVGHSSPVCSAWLNAGTTRWETAAAMRAVAVDRRRAAAVLRQVKRRIAADQRHIPPRRRRRRGECRRVSPVGAGIFGAMQSGGREVGN